MVSLAKLSGATILPLFCIQQDNEKATVIIEAPIQIDVNGERESGLERSIRQYAGLLESYIRRYPEQYLNWEVLLAPENCPANRGFPIHYQEGH
jgi:lauroyl/myristoyl acyltransferase